MRRSRLWFMVAVPVIVAGLVYLGLGRSSTTIGGSVLANSPVKVAPANSAGVSTVTLTAAAAKRIGIALTPVQEAPFVAGGTPRKTIPYSAVLYSTEGDTWVFTSSQPLTYVRQRVTVADIEDDHVVLTEGPPTGTQVVTVGAAELWGAEEGVGGE